jgi:hypothetical protein
MAENARARIERTLNAEARRLLAEANGDAVPTPPWRDRDYFDRILNDLPPVPDGEGADADGRGPR